MKLVNIANNRRTLFLFCRNDKGELSITEKKDFFPYFYTPAPDGKYTSYKGEPLRKIILSNPSEVKKSRTDNAMEADILFVRRYLIDKVETLDECPIKYAFIDIEVLADELPDVTKALNTISCISIYNSLYKSIQTFYLGDYKTEYELIEDFIKYMKKEQFDLWLSWNVKFDYNYLVNRFPDFGERISPVGHTRYGDGDVFYPCGISIVDYLTWFKKVTLNRASSYALDAVAQKYLKEQANEKIDFGTLNSKIKEKNINDIERMVKLEEKFKLVSYYDEVRRLSKVEWEDMTWNSRVIDMLLLQEARKKGVVLPMKPKDNEKEDFQGAFREVYQTGAFYGVGKYDIGSAYPYAIINFGLDPANIIEIDHSNKVLLSYVVKKETSEMSTEEIEKTLDILTIEETVFKQDSNALLPTVVKRLITLKNNIKQKLSTMELNSVEYKDQKIKYNAIKSIVNSAYGVMGNRFFRLYDKRIASATTFLVRDLLHYVKEGIEKKGYKVIYIDTDSVFVKDDHDISDILNNLVKQWAKEKYRKDKIDIDFEYKGRFEKMLILTKCRYVGYLNTGKGIEEEIKGVEARRKDSTVFMKKFQRTLIDKILDKESKKGILKWIKLQISLIKDAPIEEIAFPCKLGRPISEYKNVPIFLRALRNTEGFKKKVGDPFFYIFVTPERYETKMTEQKVIQTYDKKGTEKGFKNFTPIRLKKAIEIANIETELTEDEKLIKLTKVGLYKSEMIESRGKALDVLAFGTIQKGHINREKLDWDTIIKRNIYMKLDVIFEAMKWDISEVLNEEKN